MVLPMKIGSSLVVVAFLGASPFASGQTDREFEKRCGECWCINDPEGSGVECPKYEEGINDAFPAEFHQSLETFKEISDPITLQSSSGSSECFPFADTVTPIDGYPESNRTACVVPESGVSTVCAFKFVEPQVQSNQECCGREYELKTYDSKEEAEADNAQVTHTGACGVCSNAADWAVRIKRSETIEEQLVLCATVYAFGGNFDELVNCHMEVSDRIQIGFTKECATLWAHNAACNAKLCTTECAPGFAGEDIPLNGPAPQCELSECLTCSDSGWGAAFDGLSGRTMAGSGFTEDIARPCSAFAAIDHEPCGGEFYCKESAPPPTPDTSGCGLQNVLSAYIAFMFVSCFIM